MFRKGVAAKIWTKIWDSGNLVGGGGSSGAFLVHRSSRFFQNAHSVIEYRNFCLEYCFSIDNTIIRDNVPINIPTTHRTHALIRRRKPPKPGKNSDFGPNPDFFQRFWWCVSGGGHVSPERCQNTISYQHPRRAVSKLRIRLLSECAFRNLETRFSGFVPGFTIEFLW